MGIRRLDCDIRSMLVAAAGDGLAGKGGNNNGSQHHNHNNHHNEWHGACKWQWNTRTVDEVGWTNTDGMYGLSSMSPLSLDNSSSYATSLDITLDSSLASKPFDAPSHSTCERSRRSNVECQSPSRDSLLCYMSPVIVECDACVFAFVVCLCLCFCICKREGERDPGRQEKHIKTKGGGNGMKTFPKSSG